MVPDCCRELNQLFPPPSAWEKEEHWDAGLEGHSSAHTPMGETPQLHNIPLTASTTTKSFNKSITRLRIPNNKITAKIYFQCITFQSKGLDVKSFLLFFFSYNAFWGADSATGHVCITKELQAPHCSAISNGLLIELDSEWHRAAAADKRSGEKPSPQFTPKPMICKLCAPWNSIRNKWYQHCLWMLWQVVFQKGELPLTEERKVIILLASGEASVSFSCLIVLKKKSTLNFVTTVSYNFLNFDDLTWY